MKKLIYLLLSFCLISFSTMSCDSMSKDSKSKTTKKHKSHKYEAEEEEEDDYSTSSSANLNDFVESLNSELPIEINEAMYINTSYIEGAYFIIEYVMDDNVVDITDIDPANVSRSDKLDLIDGLYNTNDECAALIRTLSAANKGLCCRYVADTTGDYVDIKVSCNDINRYLNN